MHRARFTGAGFAGLASVAALFAVEPARADTIVENFTLNGTAVKNNSGANGITSSSFADFDPSLGTLTGLTLSFSGQAYTSGSAFFTTVTAASVTNSGLFSTSGSGSGVGDFAISASGTDPATDLPSFVLAAFEGTGMTALLFDFIGSVTLTNQSGTLTYDYTPATPPTGVPEPGTLTLFGAGLAGLLFRARHGRRRAHPSAAAPSPAVPGKAVPAGRHR